MDTAAAQTVTRRDLDKRLVEKAWRDPVFRKDVLKHPKGMFEPYTGQKRFTIGGAAGTAVSAAITKPW